MMAEDKSSIEISSGKGQPIEAISINGLFNIFTIFFVSTVALGFSLLSYSLPDFRGSPYFYSVFAILISIFFIGYIIVAIVIIIFNLIRFSKFAMKLYRNHETGFKLSLLLIFIICFSIIASYFAANDAITLKIIGFAGLAIIGVIIVALQNIIIAFAEPYTNRLSNWLQAAHKK